MRLFDSQAAGYATESQRRRMEAATKHRGMIGRIASLRQAGALTGAKIPKKTAKVKVEGQ